MQFIGPSRTNPPATGKEMKISPEVEPILKRACFDCHSNNTVWPWYSNIMPVKMLLANHVNDGRKRLNFSEWENYPLNKKTDKLMEICEQVDEKKMPLDQYLYLHSNAKLSGEDMKAICDWTDREGKKLDEENK